MAGFKLPDYTALGAPNIPGASDRVASAGNVGQYGASQEQVGGVLQDAGSKLQDIVNVANVNDAMANNFQPKVNELAANFYSLQGKAAMDAAPQFTQQLQQAMNDASSGLTGDAQRAFQRQAQPIIDSHAYKAAMHAGEQAKWYADTSNQAAITNHIADYSQNLIGDPNAAEDAQHLAFTQMSSYLQSRGFDPSSDVAKMKMTDLQKQFDDARDGTIQQTFFALPPDQQRQIALQKLSPQSANTPAPAASPIANISQALLGQESGNNPNAATSVDGAVGKEQITPGTFALYAKPGESITDPTARAAVFGRMMDDYGARYNNDPQRIAVAYFSGPSNVAPAGSATPWLRDTQDGNGKSVSSYVSDINKRLAPGQYSQDGSVMNDASGTISSTAAPITGQQPQAAQNPTLFGQPISQEVAAKLTQGALSNYERAQKLQKLSDEQNFDKVQNDFFSKEHANQLTWQDIQTSDLPVQGTGGKEWWNERLNKGQDKTDPEVFNTLIHRAMLPDGDPNKLTDPREVQAYVGKGITPANMGVLNNIMGGGEEKEMKNQTLKVIKTQVSGEDRFPGMKDPKGEELYASAMPLVFKAIDDGKAKGVPNSQLYDPASPNWVGNAAKPLIRPPDKWYSDLSASNLPDNMGLPSDEKAANASKPGFWSYFNPFSSPHDDAVANRLTSDLKAGKLAPSDGIAHIKDAYSRGFITRQQAADMLVTNGLAQKTAPAAASAPQVPQPE